MHACVHFLKSLCFSLCVLNVFDRPCLCLIPYTSCGDLVLCRWFPSAWHLSLPSPRPSNPPSSSFLTPLALLLSFFPFSPQHFTILSPLSLFLALPLSLSLSSFSFSFPLSPPLSLYIFIILFSFDTLQTRCQILSNYVINLFSAATR